jgi:hypothetical protein
MLVGGYGFGQKTITIQIDTLELNGYVNFHISLPNNSIKLSKIVAKSNYSLNTSHPNFTCQLEIESDSSNIEIAIDDGGGYIIIHDVNKLKKGVLQINKLAIIEICFNDSTHTKKEYYKVSKEGTIGEPIKIKQHKNIQENECKTAHIKELSFTINGNSYLVALQKEIARGYEFTGFHGGYPKKYLDNRSAYTKPYKYFYGTIVNYQFINVGKINLQN